MDTRANFSVTVVLGWVFFLVCNPAAAASYSGGSGTADDPYLISTAEDMQSIGANKGDWDKHFLLTTDIDLSCYTGTEFNIIGYYKSYYDNKPFTAVFDGNDHTIFNFTYTTTDTDHIGLFGYVNSADAVIKNLTLVNPDVNAAGDSCYVGCLVGKLRSGTITGCGIEGGSVTGYGGTGGLMGENDGTISNCYATVSVIGYVGYVCTGGLVGSNHGTISNCYATGSVTGGNDCTGGLLGWNGDGTIENCYASGRVTGDNRIGGLVGGNYKAAVSASFWDIETTGQSGSYGGEGKTTAQMKTASTFVGWAACGNEEVWTIDEGQDYPRLAWEGRPGELLPIQELSDFLTGSGTAADPYLIYTAQQLNLIGLFICEWDRHFVLTNDIDLSGYTGTQFNIIGQHYRDRETQEWIENPFTGVFDGNGFTISNFTYKFTRTGYIGLFGYIDDADAVVKDLTLTDPNVEVYRDWDWDWDCGTSALVGELKAGTITGCSVDGGSVTGNNHTGGLVGYNNYKGTISNSYAAGRVTGDNNTGGLVGRNEGTISNCYVAGGVIGGPDTGGLVGSNHGTISNCYAAGTVTGNLWSRWVGGLVGRNGGTIENCYATSSVTGDDYTGGLAGQNYDGTIENCYAAGSVTGDDYTGGLVGSNWKGRISACFWDIETTGQANSAGGEGKTTEQMQTQTTFTDAGWDFYMPVWKICEAVDYPRLWWEMIDWPIIDEEPEVTTGTSNTITWQEVDEAIEYYVICCSDDNLENVVAESGWVDVNEYTFDNLETPQTYWYAVKARQNCILESDWSDVVSSLQGTLGDAVDVMLDTDSLKNSNMKNALMNKIEQVLEMIDAGLYEDALKKLENDILKKTDGCIKTGQADKNDWIKTCEAQQQIYPFVMDTIDYVNSLME